MRKNTYDSRLIIYKSRRTGLTLLVLFMLAVFGVMLHRADLQNLPWFLLVPPVTLLGSVFLLFPPTEYWEYKPWQAKARRIEQHSNR